MIDVSPTHQSCVVYALVMTKLTPAWPSTGP